MATGGPLEKLFLAADNHGADSGEPDHTIGDLQGLLRSAWNIMTASQKQQLLASAEAEDLVDLGSRGEFEIGDLRRDLEASPAGSAIADTSRRFSMMERYDISPGWTVFQDSGPDSNHDEFADFDKELYRADDPVTTSIDLRVSFNTESRTAVATLSRHDDTGHDLPILFSAPVPWATGLQFIGAAQKPGVKVLEPFTVMGFDRESARIFSRRVLATDGINAFAQASDSEGLEMVAAIAGAFSEDDALSFPGESLVDSETIRDQPDVFGPAPAARVTATPMRP